jgi:hypothetical protein
LERAQEQYRRASALLADKPEGVRGCFKWNHREVAQTKNSYPDVRPDRLAGWLREAYHGLCDDQNEPPDIPREANGQPSLNPEHWDFWAACDESLWAWRQLYRTLEVARIAGTEEVIRPVYDLVPRLRSKAPNLAVYRSLGVPVFRPREGHVLLAGKLLQLRARCLTAVCIENGYVARMAARLYQYVLRQVDPLEVVASELYAGSAKAALAEQEVGANDLAADGTDAEDQTATGVEGADGAARATAGAGERSRRFSHEVVRLGFLALRESDPREYTRWLSLAEALLDTVLLGLPDSFLTTLLRNEYGCQDLNERDVRRLRQILVNDVAYELAPFLEDITSEVVAARLGLTVNEELRQFLNPDHPAVTGPTLRNALKRHRRPITRLLRSAQAQSGSRERPRTRAEWYQYRALTPGGRVTARAASAAVRRQQVLMAEEEVMLAVAHDLAAAGYPLLGLAGSEFVVEMPTTQASDRECENVARVASEAAGRILGDLPARIGYGVVERW